MLGIKVLYDSPRVFSRPPLVLWDFSKLSNHLNAAVQTRNSIRADNTR